MNNVEGVRKNLSEVFEQLRKGEVDVKTASELANLAGKMIGTAKVQLEYYALRKERPDIDFLASTKPVA